MAVTVFNKPLDHVVQTIQESKTAASGGTDLSMVTTGEKYVWNNKLDSSLKGANSGLAELDSAGKVPSSQLPSYVDDVVEYADTDHFPLTGESGKIYVATDSNKTYRWSGSGYTEISPSLTLGETSATAYRGDRGASAYTHAVTNKGSAFASGLYKIATNSEGHVTGATAVQKSDITGLGIPESDTTYSSKSAANGGTEVSLVTTGEKYTWNNKSTLSIGTTGSTAAAGNHTHGLSIATDSGTNQITLAANTKYKLTAGGSTYIFTTPPDNNTNTWRPVSDSVSSTSSSDAASSKAVKTAYDLAASKTANTGTVTKISTSDGITGGDITTSGTIKLATSGVTAGSYGPSANVTGSNNATISVPYITVDKYGRVTSISNKTYTSVDHTYTVPTKVSQLTNDSGFLTGITKTLVTNALGYTPPPIVSNTTGSFANVMSSGQVWLVGANTVGANFGFLATFWLDGTTTHMWTILNEGFSATANQWGTIAVSSTNSSYSSIRAYAIRVVG